MKYGNLILAKNDYVRLKRLLNFHKYYEDLAHKDALNQLKHRIENAQVKDDIEIPDDIVRLYSKVTFLPEQGLSRTVEIVPPSEANTGKKKISVISTLGSNLVGLAVDDTIQIRISSDIQSLKILKVKGTEKLSSRSFLEMDM